ncbi:peptidase U32 family protein [Segatella oulorum]|uniref:peptidase U32 family protein n=1 Tax=Segatella oulorum TaxID=28136 RepID=UPI0023F4A063|nr:U32 family peptidase [Segatella oulorum]
MQTLELLAPAKTAAIGIEAIRHGADAVYIGADSFGARSAAGNSIADIAQLCQYAHTFGARVYVTINTLVYEHEIAALKQLLSALDAIEVDALLLQDMGVYALIKRWTTAEKWHFQLHASTQTDNRSANKVAWLQALGFQRAVLARELSVEEIAAIHAQVPRMELEVFVHGALCVGYSGVCYASQHCFGRSANRGACAQFCRMKFDLVDATGKEIEHQRHLLSLKDLNQLNQIEQLVTAGACSFKIEGRLKEADYVKNVVSAYSQQLNAIVKRHPQHYRRASWGEVDYHFTPDLNKTFNRGYTHYFLDGRVPHIANFDTPKAMGEFVGTVKAIRGHALIVAGVASFSNGDGLCFVNAQRELEGFRVNRVEGNKLYPQRMPQQLREGMRLYRNQDVAFDKILAKPTAERRMALDMLLSTTADGFFLQAKHDGMEEAVSCTITFAHEKAKSLQADNMRMQLTKLGGTEFVCRQLTFSDGVEQLFLPSSLLAQLRRGVVTQLKALKPLRNQLLITPKTKPFQQPISTLFPAIYQQHPYLYNIANAAARDFYAAEGLDHLQPAFELAPPTKPLVMQCRHCLRYELGFCVKRGGQRPTWKEPLTLRLGDGRRFTLDFDCTACQMNIYAET